MNDPNTLKDVPPAKVGETVQGFVDANAKELSVKLQPNGNWTIQVLQ